ncbi:MAG: Response regulator containing a CheY-like receiver domain and a domain protein [Bacteroidota bacterium]|jgi:serine phosphatase RsbU (regulator of sigma subunit)|nr:Response regulator containing a CheY-like receiver domain and a domain protein [Bacteroidota bacterium]
MKKALLYFLSFVFIFLQSFSFAQKTGYHIRNYSPKEYKGYNQVWQATQDHNGIMYFASSSNVFSYSGQFWETIKIKAGAATRQLLYNASDKTIYVGTAGDFGCLQRDSSNRLKFNSFVSQLTETQRAFNDIWKVYAINDCIYFQASERIFKVKDKKVIKVIESSEGQTFALSFVCNGRFYVRQRNVGLMEIINDKLHPVPGGEIFKDSRLLSMLPYDDKRNIIVTGDEGIYQFDKEPDLKSGSHFSKGVIIKDDFLLNGTVLGAKWVNDTTFLVFSRTGIAFYSKEGKQKELINKSSGLNEETIAEVFIDREKNLWLMTQNGISCLGYNSPILSYDDKSGYSGVAEAVMMNKGRMYVATTNGLFVAKKGTVPNTGFLSFIPTEIINTEVWDLVKSGNYVYVATSYGLYRYSDAGSVKLTDNITNSIQKFGNSDTLVIAEKNGFSIVDGTKDVNNIIRSYELSGEDVLRLGRIKRIKADVYEAWAFTRYRDALHITFSIKDSSLAIKRYTKNNGIGQADWFMLEADDSLYLCKTDSCLRYDPKMDKAADSKCFSYAPDIFKKLCDGKLRGILKPFNHHLILFKKDSIICYGESEAGSLITAKMPLTQRFVGSAFSYAKVLPDGKILIVVDEQIIIYDSKYKVNGGDKFQCLIKNVLINNDSVIYYGGDEAAVKYEVPVNYDKSRIRFRFQSAYFYPDAPALFTYHLDGYDNDTVWSELSYETQKDYTNLPEGNYVFRVKARNPYGKFSEEASFAFTISPPWYRSVLAYVLYLLLFLVIIYAAVKISSVRLRNQKEKLEGMVKERTAEVVAQKHMLETAYIEIKDSMRYARRIQNALLASDKLLEENLKDYFIYYKPKDIVSGDFYWAHAKGDWFYMITADCTGHGVPGAFMSLLNISFLNEAINETSFVSPAEILGMVRSRIIEALRSDGSEEGGKDGMDCVLCAYNFNTRELLFAAANNSLLIYRNKDLITYKPDKYPVGRHDREEEPFHLHSVKLQQNDIVYTYTDGYADQFGGADGKKFKLKQLKELLLSIAHLPMNEQKDVVSKTMRKWKKGIDQIDDILVVGVRIS